MAKLITVVLDPETAEFSLDLTGFKGQGCAAIAEAFAELGNVKTSVTKPEYRQQVQNTVRK